MLSLGFLPRGGERFGHFQGVPGAKGTGAIPASVSQLTPRVLPLLTAHPHPPVGRVGPEGPARCPQTSSGVTILNPQPVGVPRLALGSQSSLHGCPQTCSEVTVLNPHPLGVPKTSLGSQSSVLSPWVSPNPHWDHNPHPMGVPKPALGSQSSVQPQPGSGVAQPSCPQSPSCPHHTQLSAWPLSAQICKPQMFIFARK